MHHGLRRPKTSGTSWCWNASSRRRRHLAQWVACSERFLCEIDTHIDPFSHKFGLNSNPLGIW